MAGATLMLSGVSASANPQFVQEPVVSTLFSDDFSSGFSSWTVGTNTVGRTQFGQTPTLVTGATGGVPTYAKFKVDTYNSRGAGTTLSGTQINTNQTFALPTTAGVTNGEGIQFQITARVETTGLAGVAGNAGDTSTPVAEGLNAASFSYGYSAPASSNYLNEIDIENLTQQQSPPTLGNPTGKTGQSNSLLGTSTGDATLLTSYKTTANGSVDNSYYAQTPYAAKDTGSTTTPISIYSWHTYDIDWFPTQIDWYVDGQLVREEAAGETSTANPTLYIPNQPMAYYLNFWAPSSSFGDAYSASLAPSSTAAGNNEYYYDTANASVSVVAPAGTVPEPATFGFAGLLTTALLCRRSQKPPRSR